MWFAEVPGEQIHRADRWTAAFFNQAKITSKAAFPMRRIGLIAAERRGTSDPQLLGNSQINYLGLENVRSLTGELCDFSPRPAASIKSRSKLFKLGDVLYGRLRPELNKVFLCEEFEGLCSGEFIVLTPNEKIILPRVFRHLLASNFVTQFAARLKVGASLPRMGTQDLLNIPIPVPPMDVQERLENQLTGIDRELKRTRTKLETLPFATADALLECLQRGLPGLPAELLPE